MNNKLSLSLISALPEDSLAMAPRESLSRGDDNDNPLLDPSQGFAKTVATPATKPAPPVARALPKSTPGPTAVTPALFDDEQPFAEPALPAVSKSEPEPEPGPEPEPEKPMFAGLAEPVEPEAVPEEKPTSVMVAEFIAMPADEDEDLEQYLEAKPAAEVIQTSEAPAVEETESTEQEEETVEMDSSDSPDLKSAGFSTLPPKRSEGSKPWISTMGPREKKSIPEVKLGIKASGPQSELSLDSTPRGRFEGENPNVFDGEDLDLPPFLRKKK
jgi:hypothetical protein